MKMKKKLLSIAVGAAALPLAALPLTAQAQDSSNVEFYGHLAGSIVNVSGDDATGDSLKSTTFLNYTGDSVTVPSTILGESRLTQNWVGIRGEVPLYNDSLSLVYQVERGLDIAGMSRSDTSEANDLTVRNTFVGLAGDNWGRIFIGNYDGVVKQAEGRVDLFNHTVADMRHSGISGQNRYIGTVNYQSPDWSGLTVNAQLLGAAGRAVDATKTAPSIDDMEHGAADGFGLGLSYTSDTLWANLAYEQSGEFHDPSAGVPKTNTVPIGPLPSDFNISTLRLTAGIDVGNIHGAFLVQQRSADDQYTQNTHGVDEKDKTQYMISGAYDVTENTSLKLSYAQAPEALVDDADKLKTINFGVDYALGKNVNSYFLYSNQSESDGDAKRNVAAIGLEYDF